MRTIFLLLILIPLVFTETITDEYTVTNIPPAEQTSDATANSPTQEADSTATQAPATEASAQNAAADANTPSITPDVATPSETPDTTTPAATPDTTTPAATPDVTTPSVTPDATSAETHVAAPAVTTPQSAVTTPQSAVTTPQSGVTTAKVTKFTGPAPTLYGGLILPYVRASTVFNTSDTTICGGTAKDKVHFMTSQSVLNEFRWYIETPFPDSVCTFRITENIDQTNDAAYVVVAPKGRKDVRADGSFPCGRTAGTDSAFFDIPDEIDCDTCVLEWIWSGPNFEVRQCSDITVMSGEDATCLGTCLNGGMCQRGVCVCPPGYTGDNCQYAPGAIIKSFKKIFIIIGAIVLAVVLILVAVAILSWCADKRIKDGERDQRYHTNKKYLEFDGDAPNQPSGVDQPAGHLRAEPRSAF